MKVSYVFPQFLVPSQAFALSDILALKADGHEVIVHTIKPPAKNQEAQDGRNGVPPDLAIMRPSLRGAAHWLRICWRSRSILAPLAWRIVRVLPRQPKVALGALLALPRCAEIAAEIDAQKPDVVHLFWSRHASLVFPILASQRNQALLSAFVGAYDLVADDFLTRMAMDEAEILFTHAEANRPYLADRAPAQAPLHVVHRGIPVTCDGEASTGRDRKLWTTASALFPSKNVEAVIRAFARASEHDSDLHLAIFGDGPDRKRLEALATALVLKGSVRFHGHVDRAELMQHMRQAQIFLLLSQKPSERLPNVVKEAMLAGCGIIVSQSEGIEELVVDAAVGVIVDADDEDAIDRAVAAIAAESAETGDARREAARQLIEQKFSATHSMREYCKAWQAARSKAGSGVQHRAIAE